jgi:hypothetical protein
VDHHFLVHGAAATILVVVGGFFMVASWRGYAKTAPVRGTSAAGTFGRAELVPLIGVPLAGLVLVLVLIALASANRGPHHEGHGTHGWAPGNAVAVIGASRLPGRSSTSTASSATTANRRADPFQQH